MKRRVLAIAVLSVSLTGCFGSSPEETITPPRDSSTPSATSSTVETPTVPSDVYISVLNSQAEGEFVGAATDVVSSSCAGDGGVWVGAGTVGNPTEEDVNYRVWVSFIDSDGETIGLVQSNVDGVAPNETGEYAASMPYSDPGELSCVLRVERRVAD